MPPNEPLGDYLPGDDNSRPEPIPGITGHSKGRKAGIVIGAALLAMTFVSGCGGSKPTTPNESAFDNQPGNSAKNPALSGNRTATNHAFLVSCGEKYNKAQLHPLPKSFRDMDDFRKALLETGFDEDHIVFLHDGTEDPQRFLPEKDKIVRELKLLLAGVETQDTLIIALNGHGLHFKGDKTSYFCPLNAKIGDKSTMIAMDGEDGLFPILKNCKANRKLLIVGACRNDPAKTSQAAETIDLDLFDPDVVPEGIAALYSCRAGQKTYFEENLDRSYFFDHLVRAWRGEYHPGEDRTTLEAIFDKVREKTTASVRKAYGEAQVPEIRREYQGEWMVSRGRTVTNPMIVKPLPKSVPSAITANTPKAGDERDFEIADGLKMKFCWIPAGKATLGSPNSEDKRDENEKEHPFETNGFWMGKYEVTQSEWEKVMGENRSRFKGPKLPVEMVSWDGSQEFIKKCGVRGMTLKLPHEDQWEYACRGGKGNTEAFHWGNVLNGDKENCNGYLGPYGTSYEGVHLGTTTEAGHYAVKSPHPWGLCDMHGNVQEWCDNLYPGGYKDDRLIRGGSWRSHAHACRSARRYYLAQFGNSDYIGFRVILNP